MKLFQFCKIVTAGSVLALFALGLCLSTFQEARAAQAIEVDRLVLKQDTVWENEILVKGDVEVPTGITLTIMPGTVVKFSKIEEYGRQQRTEKELDGIEFAWKKQYGDYQHHHDNE